MLLMSLLLTPAVLLKLLLLDAVVAAADHKACAPRRAKYAQVGSCAVVSSSGSLLGAKQGAAIDAHDAVIRFNDAPTLGFEDFVGRRTTFRYVNHVCTSSLARNRTGSLCRLVLSERADPSTFLTVYPSALGRTSLCYRFLAVHRAIDISDYQAYEKAACPRGTHHVVLSGTRGVLAALFMCHAVTLFGFNASHNARYPYHYYDRNRGNKKHDVRCDDLYIARLARRNPTRLRYNRKPDKRHKTHHLIGAVKDAFNIAGLPNKANRTKGGRVVVEKTRVVRHRKKMVVVRKPKHVA